MSPAVPVDVKFCGLTRGADAALGAALGAGYLGVVFAESPRRVSAAGARAIFDAVPKGGRAPKRVGVFGAWSSADIALTAREVGLDVVQLHGDPNAGDVGALRSQFDGEIWAACRVAGDAVPEGLELLAAAADRLLVDSRSGNGRALGGTGTTFDWDAVASHVASLGPVSIVVAGGLTPDNVARAIEVLSPSVVDVSSGVEESPGIKSEALMRAFIEVVGANSK